MKLSVVKKFFVDNAPAIFTGLAITSSIETTVLTAMAVPKVLDEVHDLRHYITVKPEPETIDYIRVCWKHCVPPALSLSATILFILAANQAHIQTEAGLAALCSWYESNHKSYREKNREIFGEENDERVYKEVVKDRIEKNRPSLYPGRAEEYLVYDPVTDQYFYATYKEKEHAQEQLNRILGKESAVAYNFLLSCFKNADHKTKIGNLFGWFLDDSFAEYYYWNESFYGRPYAELEFENADEVTDQQEDIYILRCSLEPLAENNMDDSEVMDSQDKQAV